MTSKQDIIARINKMRPFEVQAGDAYAYGQNDTIDRVVSLLEALLDEDGVDAAENLNPIDLKTEPEIRASATFDVLLVNECDHDWVRKSSAGYRSRPIAICVKCHAEKTYCPKCGDKL
jgi:hypothetical protein